MLKKFFISMLGSMAAIWLSFTIIVIGLVITISVCVTKNLLSSGSAPIQGEKILYLPLKGSINERDTDVSFMDLIQNIGENSDGLMTMLQAIEKAKSDKDIKGIYLDCYGSEMGLASRKELIEAIQDFKECGKFVYAYADNFDQGDYYVASVADKVYLNPVGMLNIHGLSANVIFYKDVLDKIGVNLDVVRVGSFKSAVEPYMRMDMSPESRLQTETFLTQIWTDMKGTIATNRGLCEQDLDNFADSIYFTWDPQKYVDTRTVTKLCYRSEVESMLRKQMGKKDDEDIPLISPKDYLATKGMDLIDSSSDHIAVLFAVGEIYDEGEEGIVSENIVPEIQKLANDDKVKALILRVNSPGGSAFASEQIWKALEDFKEKGKPFYVSMSDYAASGGYYISCGADKIYCDASTLTGSIGIFGVIPSAKALLRDKIGLGYETVETNKDANFPDIFNGLTPNQLAAMQAYVERGYDTFTSRVAAGRNIPQDSVKVIGGGRVWDGISAKKIGLVDEIGSLADVVTAMNKHLKADYKTVEYPRPEGDPISMIKSLMSGQVQVNIPGLSDEQTKELYDQLKKIRSIAPIQARMDNITIK